MYHICTIFSAKHASGSHGSFHLRHYYMHLKDNIFDDMEITLSPNFPMSKRIIVEALKDKYAPKALIKNSSLENVVKFK